jgi:hypothetical protein
MSGDLSGIGMPLAAGPGGGNVGIGARAMARPFRHNYQDGARGPRRDQRLDYGWPEIRPAIADRANPFKPNPPTGWNWV